MTSTPATDRTDSPEGDSPEGDSPEGDSPEGAEPSDHEELIMFLERDQLVSNRSKPVARAQLGRGATQALWALRIFVLVVSFMVIYTFIAQLR
jgi:hypothetical protein